MLALIFTILMSSLLSITPNNRSAIAWVLIVAFLLQPILSYLVTPMPMKNEKGFHTVICTLNGIKEVYVDLPSISGGSNVQNLDECPAIKLFEIAATVQPAAFFLTSNYSIVCCWLS